MVLSVCQTVLLNDPDAYIINSESESTKEKLEDARGPGEVMEVLVEDKVLHGNFNAVMDIISFFFGGFLLKISILPIYMTVIIIPIYLLLIFTFWYLVLDFIKDIEIFGWSI